MDGNIHLGGVESCSSLVKFARPLDLEHEVAAIDVLHHEVEAVRRLEAGVQAGQEWVVGGQGEDPLLRHCAFDIIILDDHILLKHLKK